MEGAMAGAFFEIFVVMEILKSYYNAGTEPALFYYRDKDQKEVDILIMENGCLYPLEIKKNRNAQKTGRCGLFSIIINQGNKDRKRGGHLHSRLSGDTG